MKRSIALGVAALAVVGLLVTLTARAPLGARNDPLPASRFLVEIDGIVQTNFREVSGLQCTTEVVEYRDGTDGSIRLLPGASRCGPVVLKGGLTTSMELWNWYEATLNGDLQRKNAAIVIFDATGAERARYTLSNAWPMKYVVGPFNAAGNDVAIEELDLAVERIDRA